MYLFRIYDVYHQMCMNPNLDIETIQKLFIWILTCIIWGGIDKNYPLHVYFEESFT